VAHTIGPPQGSSIARSFGNPEGAPFNALFVEWVRIRFGSALFFPLIRENRANEWGTLGIHCELSFLLARRVATRPPNVDVWRLGGLKAVEGLPTVPTDSDL
jgi:hypothetical protein